VRQQIGFENEASASSLKISVTKTFAQNISFKIIHGENRSDSKEFQSVSSNAIFSMFHFPMRSVCWP
jgi:hypothetical protein